MIFSLVKIARAAANLAKGNHYKQQVSLKQKWMVLSNKDLLYAQGKNHEIPGGLQMSKGIATEEFGILNIE